LSEGGYDLIGNKELRLRGLRQSGIAEPNAGNDVQAAHTPSQWI
jgi:hypothetical protein